jgi:transcriptional antiterminator NusG
MKDDEVRRLLSKVDTSEESGESLAEPFIIGEEIKVTEGPFQNFVGTIQDVNEEKKKLKIIIKVFGRGTEVELNFMQVEKQS